MAKQTGETQRDEHATIGGVDGKKVFVIDNAGNQIVSFGTATIALFPYNFYQQQSLVSGYNFFGKALVGSNPTTASFQVQRETLLTGEVLYVNPPTFNHQWSSASLASLSF